MKYKSSNTVMCNGRRASKARQCVREAKRNFSITLLPTVQGGSCTVKTNAEQEYPLKSIPLLEVNASKNAASK